jgi:hypothetical protein
MHSVLIEITRTGLVWITADTPAQARREADKNPQQLTEAPQAARPVDGSIDVAALTEDAAAWLDLDGNEYERLDLYFAAQRIGGAR